MKKLKKLIFIGLLCVTTLSFSQVTRFVYQASIQPDSTDTASRKIESVYLDTNGKESYFYAENRVKRDSLIQRMRATRSFDRSSMENFRSNVEYIIQKKYASGEIIFKDRIGRDQYTYTETQPMTWKILPETINIGEYKTQKAETSYGGRKWTAWFTMDLPYQDGPYKFSGLPGLIVKLQDAKGDYEFDLQQVKKIPDFSELTERGQYISITRLKFLELQTKFQRDPEAVFAASSGGRFGGNARTGAGGADSRPNTPANMQQMREQMVKRIKSNNNPIELK